MRDTKSAHLWIDAARHEIAEGLHRLRIGILAQNSARLSKKTAQPEAGVTRRRTRDPLLRHTSGEQRTFRVETGFRAVVLDAAAPILAEKVDPQAVLVGVDLGEQPVA